ncbi:hypothetical protein AXF42_Ash001725 [Apostasia shenzhenica]|uniref:DUF4378 domain-containing protein n=1 Tax=Apostasia shenzhenica TaxID=1088818 RepID=A0A2I0AB29_9ASPA|nr:hypothetical protein AXF42_Ash001725 [Apostasia shenzhenica]
MENNLGIILQLPDKKLWVLCGCVYCFFFFAFVLSIESSLLCVQSDERTVGVTASVRSGDSGYSLLTTDEEESLTRAPGVVARLMGLDSMPCSSERNSFESGSLNIYSDDQISHAVNRSNGYSTRTVKKGNLKRPGSPMERFWTERMPLKSVNSCPVSHNKLPLPMKNPESIPHRMEPLAKNFNHSSQKTGFLKAKSFGLSSSASGIKTSMESLTQAVPMRPTKLAERLRTRNDLQVGIVHRSSLLINSNRRYHSKSDAKEVNLLTNQAKFGSQVKDQPSCYSRKTMVNSQKSRQFSTLPQKAAVALKKKNLMENKEIFGSSTFSNLQRSKIQTKNFSSKKKVGNKLPGHEDVSFVQCGSVSTDKSQASKFQERNVSSTKKITNKLPGCDEVIYMQRSILTSDKEEEEDVTLKYNRLPYKKGLKENGSMISKKTTTLGSSELDSHEKSVRHNFVTDENSRWTNNNMKSGTDIVSFIFTTPIVKPVEVPVISPLPMEIGNERNQSSLDVNIKEKASCLATENQSCDVLSNIGGDALGILLEEKLKELATRINSPCYANGFQSSLLLRGTLSEPNHCLDSPDKHIGIHSDYSSADAKVLHMKEDGHQDIDWTETSSCSSSTTNHDVQKEPHQESPLSILEASFSSSESYNSPDVLGCTDNKISSQFGILVRGSGDVTCTSPLEERLQLKSESVYGHNENMIEEMKYVREILRRRGLLSECANPLHLATLGYTLDPRLFEELECWDSWNGCQRRRKLLFDYSTEWLDLKLSLYLGAGYRAWTKGLSIFGKDLVQMVYEEIASWRSVEDSMIHELLERDMSNQRGRWIDFDLEAFEAGEEIERGLLSSLVEELVADFPC